jgi:hypothetical protein
MNLGMPLSLSHHQLQAVMAAAKALPVERRGEFLQRLSTMLALKGRFDDRDVREISERAATGLDTFDGAVSCR